MAEQLDHLKNVQTIVEGIDYNTITKPTYLRIAAVFHWYQMTKFAIIRLPA